MLLQFHLVALTLVISSSTTVVAAAAAAAAAGSYNPYSSKNNNNNDNKDRWQPLPHLPIARQEHSVAAVHNRIYITGGVLSNVSYLPDDPPVDRETLFAGLSNTNTTQYYDLKTRTWHDAAPAPLNFNHGNMAAVNGKIYLLGGLSGNDFVSWNALSGAWVYDPRRDRWSSLAPMPEGTARGACAVAAYGDEIYLAGGMTQLQLVPPFLQASVTTVTSYNTRTNRWNTNYPPLPGARDHVAGAVIGHTLYVTGGRDHGQYNWRNNTWALDLRNVSAGWKSKAPMITARAGLAYAAANGKLYTFGGEGNPNDPPNMVFDNVEVYDPRSDSWQELIKMEVPRHGFNAAVVGRKIYIPGGGVRISAAPTTWFDAFDLY